jgi:hypothetical protein
MLVACLLYFVNMLVLGIKVLFKAIGGSILTRLMLTIPAWLL